MASEEWRPVPGWEREYEVSNLGRVRSLPHESRNRYGPIVVTGRMLKPYAKYGRYLGVTLIRRGRRESPTVHSIVAAAFIGPRPPKYDVCHLDDNGYNNNLENLRYDTRIGNMDDARRNGRLLRARGERNGIAKITSDMVKEIRRRVAAGATHGPLAKEIGISRSIVRNVAARRTWAHVP